MPSQQRREIVAKSMEFGIPTSDSGFVYIELLIIDEQQPCW